MHKNKAPESRSFISVLLLVSVMVLFVFSCKGKETQEKKRANVSNPYFSDTIFSETKQKTEAHPDDPDAWAHLADLYERNSQYADAIEAYGKVVKLKPSGYTYLKIGTDYDRMGQPEKAVEALKKAAHYMPGYAVIYNNLGIAYGKAGKNREEIEALEKAVKLRPSYVTARYNLGIAYLRIKDRKAALKEYELLKDLESGAAEALKKEIDSGGKQ